jgi:hypothetical protein
LGKALAVKVAEVQNMARHVLRNALVLWLSGQHLNRPCKSGEATKATSKQKWPTLRNVWIRYSVIVVHERVVRHYWPGSTVTTRRDTTLKSSTNECRDNRSFFFMSWFSYIIYLVLKMGNLRFALFALGMDILA